jgi:hypothetical protein
MDKRDLSHANRNPSADVLFDRLRTLVFLAPSLAKEATRFGPDLVPILQIPPGWICLSRNGEVGLLREEGVFDPDAALPLSRTALVASLALRVPLASWFVPRHPHPRLCPSCKGQGTIEGLAVEMSGPIRCPCGGLGWVPGPDPN